MATAGMPGYNDFMDAEAQTISWLENTVGGDWPVSGDKPKTPPPQYILVDRTGGPRESMVLDRAEILIEVYAKSRSIAKNKAQDIAGRIVELKDVPNITRAKVNSLVNLDDTIGQYHRYQLYCDVYCRM
jgi:hypothetical protein